MIIAVDFDGTIVEDNYPEIGEPKMFVFETLQQLIEKRHQLILWTTREGAKLDEAVSFCRQNGVDFYAVNKSYAEEVVDDSISRKISCDVFISNKNVGGIPGWGEIWQKIQEMEGQGMYGEVDIDKSLFGRIKKLFSKK